MKLLGLRTRSFIVAFIAFSIAIIILLKFSPTSGLSVEILDECVANDSLDDACLRRRMSELLVEKSAQDIFAYVYSDGAPPELQNICHYVGHIAGEELVRQSGSLESALSKCPSTCNRGCDHGALASAVMAELGQVYPIEGDTPPNLADLERLGKQYCARSSPLCHGFGHELYLSLMNYEKSLRACETISHDQRQEKCFQGVFMESFGNIHSLYMSTSSAPMGTSPGDPCIRLPSKYQAACVVYLPGVQKERLNGLSFDELHEEYRKTCNLFSGSIRAACIQGIGYDGGISQGNFREFPLIKKWCEALNDISDRQSCESGVAMKYLRYGKSNIAQEYCRSLQRSNDSEMCIASLETEWNIRKESLVPEESL